MLTEQTAGCPYCGEPNEIEVDLSQGDRQRYIQDCSVCCRPMQVTVGTDSQGNIRVECRSEDDLH